MIDDIVGTIETHKGVIEINSLYTGTVQNLHVKLGDVVKADHPFCDLKLGMHPKETTKVDPPKELPKIVPSKEPVKSDVSTEPPKTTPLKDHLNNGTTRVPMTKLRMLIAHNMKESQNTNAFLTTFNEIDMRPLVDLRAKYKDEFLKKHNIKLGFMSSFMKASSVALQEIPQVNAFIEGTDVLYHNHVHISIAVATPKGLVTPVVRNVEKLSFVEIEKTLLGFSTKAREFKLPVSDLLGGTFTISNGGVFGSLFGTPIINVPQSAILGMHSIKERPVVVNGVIAIREMMYVALTYDHRLIDGREAVSFLQRVKELIESPERLLFSL